MRDVHDPIMAAYQKAVLAKLLGVEKVDFPGLELRPIEGVFYYHQVGVVDTVTGLDKAKTRLLIQRWVVAEPDPHCARVSIKTEFIVTVKQCFERGRSHDCFARAGYCRE